MIVHNLDNIDNESENPAEESLEEAVTNGPEVDAEANAETDTETPSEVEDGDPALHNLNETVRELTNQLLEEKMHRETDRKKFQAAVDHLYREHKRQLVEMSARQEKQKEEECERAVKNFIVKNVLQICDFLEDMVSSLEEENPDIAESASISLKKILTCLSNEGFEEVEVKAGDKYNQKIHQAIEVVEAEEAENDSVFRVYKNAWIAKKGEEAETIRHANVCIAKNKR